MDNKLTEITPRVLILMSTYNGELYVKEQLESILKQVGVEIHLLIRDDGSKDNTKSILRRFKEQNSNITVIEEDNIGTAHSFMHLMQVAETLSGHFDYFAFSDQDDVWLKNKLIVAIKYLDLFKKELPLIYCSKPQLVDQNLNPLKTNWIDLNCSFGESMIVNGALGCTEVFNKNLLKLINSFKPSFITMHDAWVYRVCLATGGKVYYDHNSYILYRQHSQNVIGGKTNFFLKWRRRVGSVINNQRNIRSLTAKNLLLGYNNKVSKENRKLLIQISQYQESFKSRLKLFSNPNLKTKSGEHNFIFKLVVMLGYY